MISDLVHEGCADIFWNSILLECLRDNDLTLRKVSMMLRRKPDLLLFRTIARTGGLLSKPALGISVS